MIIVCCFWRVVKPHVMRLPIIPGTPWCLVTNQSYLVYVSVFTCQACGLSPIAGPTARSREDAWCLGSVAWDVKRWEVEGCWRAMGHLVESPPTYGWSCDQCCTWMVWRVGFKYFSSEKRLRFLILLSVSCHRNVNCFSAIISVAYCMQWDKDVKWAGPSERGSVSLSMHADTACGFSK